MRSVSIRKQITTISVVANQFIFCSCIISTVLQLFYDKNSSKKTIEPSKQAHNAKKTESVKTEQSVAIWVFQILMQLQKLTKIRTTWAICILIYCKRNFYFIALWSKTKIIFTSVKVFVFSARSNNFTQEDPKGFTWYKH